LSISVITDITKRMQHSIITSPAVNIELQNCTTISALL